MLSHAPRQATVSLTLDVRHERTMNLTSAQLSAITTVPALPKALQVRDIPLQHFHGIPDGKATFTAIKNGVDALVAVAPADHDVLVVAFGIVVHRISMHGDNTLIFSGFDGSGNHTNVIAHYTQVVASVSYIKKAQERERVITGFGAILNRQ